MFDTRFDQLTPEQQAAVATIAQRMGIATPAGVIGNQVVDAQGNPIAKSSDINQWRGLVSGLTSGSIDPSQILSSGSLQAMPAPAPSGLAGAEQAIEAGTTSALSTLGQSADTARNDLTTANNTAQQQLADNKTQVVQTALDANRITQDQIQQGKEQLTNAAMYTNDTAQQLLQGGKADVINAALYANRVGQEPLQAYSQAGQLAQAQQAALSGLLGKDAQQAAFDDFMASPGQEFLRDSQEKALLRNSAAIGGLGGGNVRTALQQQALGNAAQDFGNYYARLGETANRGAQAGQGMTSLASALGGNVVNQLGGFSTQGAGIAGNLGGNVVNAFGNLTGQGAGIAGNLGNNVVSQIGSSNQLGANLTAGYGQNMANTAYNTGLNAANLLGGAGNNMANYRYDTGVNLANTLSGGSAQLANLANNAGASYADLIGQYAGNLSNLLGGTGSQLGTSDQALATLLANIATQSGSQYSSLPGIPGIQNGTDHLTSAGNLLTGIGAGAKGLQSLM